MNSDVRAVGQIRCERGRRVGDLTIGHGEVHRWGEQAEHVHQFTGRHRLERDRAVVHEAVLGFALLAATRSPDDDALAFSDDGDGVPRRRLFVREDVRDVVEDVDHLLHRDLLRKVDGVELVQGGPEDHHRRHFLGGRGQLVGFVRIGHQSPFHVFEVRADSARWAESTLILLYHKTIKISILQCSVASLSAPLM